MVGSFAPELSERDQLLQELAQAVEVDVERLTVGARLRDDVGLDSLQFVSCLAWLENQGIVVTDDPIAALATVEDVLDLIASRRSLGPSGRLLVGGGERKASSATGTSPVWTDDQESLEPVLRNSMYMLRPVMQSDTSFLYELATRPETGYRWRYRGTVPPIERFASEIWQNTVLAQFVVVAASSGQAQGLVVCYQADMVNGHASIGAAFSQEVESVGLPATAVGLFIQYLFRVYPFRKLYLEVPGWNMAQIASGVGSYFHDEGRLRGHDYYDGKYWDKHILAMYRVGGAPPSETS